MKGRSKTKTNKWEVSEKEDRLKDADLRVLAVTPIVEYIFLNKKIFSLRDSTFPLIVYHHLNTMLHPGMNVLCVYPQNHLLSELSSKYVISRWKTKLLIMLIFSRRMLMLQSENYI